MQPEEKVEVKPVTLEVSATSENVQDELPEMGITELEDEVLASIMKFTKSRKVTTNVAINALMNTYVHILSLTQKGHEMVDTILQHSRAIVNLLIPRIVEQEKNQPVEKSPVEQASV